MDRAREIEERATVLRILLVNDLTKQGKEIKYLCKKNCRQYVYYYDY